MDKITLELIAQWKEASDLVVLHLERSHLSLKASLEINKKLWDRCKEKNLDMNQLLKIH
jgi:hypothetical protein